jgi:predicted nucleic acid-binding protein
MIVVSNTTPLIGLAVIDQFDLLAHLFGKLSFLRPFTRKPFYLVGNRVGPGRMSVNPAGLS